jgi:hypothetical protein
VLLGSDWRRLGARDAWACETFRAAEGRGRVMMEAAPPRLPPEVGFHEGRRTYHDPDKKAMRCPSGVLT